MPTNRLRLVLRANAAFSLVSGTIALFAASWVSREVGIDHVLITRLLGVGLIVFGADVAHVSRSREPRLLRDAALISAADLSWVIVTAGIVLSSMLTTTGNIVAVVLALAVADFATMQLWFRSKALAPRGTATVPV